MTRLLARPFGALVMSVIATAITAGIAATTACSHLTDAAPPSDIADPGTVNTPQAAASMYAGVLSTMAQAFAGNLGNTNNSFVVMSGLFADEYTGASSYNSLGLDYDSHNVTPENSAGIASPYRNLQTVRIAADKAIRALLDHGGTAPSSHVAELHALKGYVYVLLSELYCSGIPFSTVAPNGAAVFGEAETTVQMSTDAIAQFDSASALAGDSTRILDLAAVGKGRALLDLGRYADAKSAVASVPTSFVYQMTYADPQYSYGNFMNQALFAFDPNQMGFYMVDHEGGHGLPYLSQSDARVATTIVAGQALPAKFPAFDTPVSLADGIEARLIEAEADLQGHDVPGWTSVLNTLREDTSMPDLTADSTTDAASDSARVDVLFRERAYWLFGTGHRAGDMRRLVRQYRRAANAVYPAGAMTYPPTPLPYLPTATVPVPGDEAQFNPKYAGCIDNDA
jgi:hypothetical protein